ncbi:Fpg/Nei family DNA glycosylase [Phycicoccus endophyticus]|uniref:Fpg/Nei family DNA glycosylase n=1 Tax=Phycicoccus endophyticus TaxID=1690220 RepID=UPI001409F4C8|nr:Fpg/Nei family DNA glycosylase [Phycicoccus endophyticus]NHI18070.1 Fpg/Nei family DNA glycosylase [Phycicoccus endophyticus]GGL26692.1 putative endonuclease 8 2 [Phycicoccus endophyticus]
MPEGDTVHRTADRLHRALAGRLVTRAELRWPSVPDVDLRGVVTLEVVARGKHILHRFATGTTLHTHLRMEGQWRVEHPGARTERALRRHDLRAAVLTEDWSALGLRLGMLDVLPTAREGDLVGHLGPDVLGPDWDPARAAANLHRHPGTLAEALLDQRVLAGVGTFWASELLFLHGLHPWAPAAGTDPDTVHRLLTRLHRLMAAAERSGWQTSTGVARAGEDGYVHARSGRPCRRCGDTVRVALAGRAPHERTVFSCPTCQGGLAPGDDGRVQRPLGSTPGPRGAYRRRTP